MKILGWGALETPLSDLGPKGANRCKNLHAPQKLHKEIDSGINFMKIVVFFFYIFPPFFPGVNRDFVQIIFRVGDPKFLKSCMLTQVGGGVCM